MLALGCNIAHNYVYSICQWQWLFLYSLLHNYYIVLFRVRNKDNNTMITDICYISRTAYYCTVNQQYTIYRKLMMQHNITKV